jgi:hypothetical protein
VAARRTGTLADVVRSRASRPARTLWIAVSTAAVVVAAILSIGLLHSAHASSGGDAIVSDTRHAATGDRVGSDVGPEAQCVTRVTCAGQLASSPLGTSMLPVLGVVAALVAAVAVTRLVPNRTPWRDRLVAGRLFRPPRLVS